MINLEQIKKVYFIGIGGIGISAIARMFKGEGKEVAGSDRADSKVIEELRLAGISVFLEQKTENIPTDAELVIYTLAITPDNPEFSRAKELNIPMLTYPEALGLVSASKYTIAVAGTHGKTTTTAMLAQIMIEADLDPTVVVGSLVPNWNSNFRQGNGKPVRMANKVRPGGYFVTEACEYKRSFLNLNPQAVIITNIDNDHLDYYKDLADIQSAFAELAAKIPADGFLVCDTHDERLAPVLAAAKCQIIDYPKALGGSTSKLELKQPGEHNQRDARAAAAAALALGVTEEIITKALAEFAGTWRRFEFKGRTSNGVMIYDDYAHHPTEIKATLAGAREWVGDKKITVVFQPHLFSRTKLLLDEFGTAFADAGEVILSDIYPAREIDDGTISSRDVVEKIKATGKEAYYLPTFGEIEARLLKDISTGQEGDIIITMGAGEAYKVGEDLLAQTSQMVSVH